ncbi:isoprenoid synthase domain-containing protein [Calycina marina]|uniref:Isoprenoid synthase domain-containing protein n=1 Tax=Calycina marina TaxID=1763456 RepID=A0A9P8CE50_9HELO|nr:isoprenoid synthase domain-containing protein [Calycina marina]
MAAESLRWPNSITPRTSSHRQSMISSALPQPVADALNKSRVLSSHPPVSNPLHPATWLSGEIIPESSKHPANETAFHGRSSWDPKKETVLLGPFDYLYEQKGKDIRRQLIAAFNEWLEIPEESVNIITKVVGMLHTASLLVDDIEDSSILRRVFGTAQTINSSNYVYFLALQELQKLNNPAAITIFTEELLNLHRGQGMDLFWRDTLTCPSEDDYLEMVGNKTGGLFRLAVKLMQASSTSKKDCVPLVNLLGIVYQIRDDYQNLYSAEYESNKGLCEDLTEGKFSFPIIHSIRTRPDNLTLLNILKQKTGNEQVKRYAVSYMKGTGSFEYCRQVLKTLEDKARELVQVLDEGREGKGKDLLLGFLDKMAV